MKTQGLALQTDTLSYGAAWEAVGGLSVPSKMPCYSWSISALICRVGGKLQTVANSVCSGCYALRNRYLFDNVQNAMVRRLARFKTRGFVPAMVYLIKVLNQSYFRWFDSGDLQNEGMLDKIAQIARLSPDTRFWLPTKEYSIVSNWLKAGNVIPANLNVRLSGYIVDADGPIALAKRLGVTISEVRREGFTCPASKQDNFCGTCRACWQKDTFNVIYKKH